MVLLCYVPLVPYTSMYCPALYGTLQYRFLKSRCAVSCLRVRKLKVVVCTVPNSYCSVRWSPLRLSSVCTPATCCNLLQLHSTTTTTTTKTESPAQRLPLRGHNNKTIPTSLKGIFILFSFYGYSLLALALVSIVLTGRLSNGPFFSSCPRQIVVYSRFTFRPTLRPPQKLFCPDINITNDSPRNVRFVLGASLFSRSLCLWWLGSVTMKSIPSVRSALLPFSCMPNFKPGASTSITEPAVVQLPLLPSAQSPPLSG